MRKTVLFLSLFLLFGKCKEKEPETFDCVKPDLSRTDFIYLENDTFRLQKQTFFPIMLNYVIAFRHINKEFVISPSIAYENPRKFEADTKNKTYKQLSVHFYFIKNLGFNTLRLTFDRICRDDKGKYYYGEKDSKSYISEDYREIFSELKKILDIAEENKLRVMLLIKSPVENEELAQFTQRLLEYFKDTPTLFAYDFMNEPLYFDEKKSRDKKDAYLIVSRWKKMMCQYAPNQLFTIGFSEPIEVFEWDPSLLPVDFVQLHTYHPLRVGSEIYWYAKYVNKPFMIGETALPADDDSISYNEQRLFMREIYNYACDAGAIGFGWWQFQDEHTHSFEASYAGLLNHKGFTYTAAGTDSIAGSLKPAAREVKTLNNYKPGKLKRPVNYFNMLGYSNICIKGTILNKKNDKPIEGAVIRGWNDNWSVGMNTYSDANGNFTLYCNDPCNHFEISAAGMNKIRFTKDLKYSNFSGENWDIHHLPNKNLEYHQIPYHPFIINPEIRKTVKQTNPYILRFDSTKFNQKKFVGKLGTLFLKSI